MLLIFAFVTIQKPPPAPESPGSLLPVPAQAFETSMEIELPIKMGKVNKPFRRAILPGVYQIEK